MCANNSQENARERLGQYRSLNRLLLCVLIAFVLWPLAMLWLHPLLPDSWRTCGSIRWFDRPCPMCGLTRGFLSLLMGNVAMARDYNLLTILLTTLLIIEVVYRSLLSLTLRFPVSAVTSMMRIDSKVHIVLVVLYVAYSVVFVALTW